MRRSCLALLLLALSLTSLPPVADAAGMTLPVTRLVPASASGAVPPPSGERSWPQTTLSTVVPPVFYDLDGNGTCEVIAADDRYCYVYDATGALRTGWPVNTGGSMMQAAIGDLDGDGVPEILIGSGYPGARLNCLTPGGASKPGWPVDLPFVTFSNTTCPVLVDIDGDQALEAGIATESGVSFFEANGTPVTGWPYLWPVPINNPQWSGPAVADVNGDGALEVAVGNACYPNWGVHLIRANGTAMPGWPKVTKPTYSSPALADLDHDGQLEIIAQEGDPGSQGSKLWVWRPDGTTLPGWPKTIAAEGYSSRCSPAIGDVDGNGSFEIVTLTGDGVLHVIEANASEMPGYPKSTAAVQPISSPSLVDVNADGIEEIFFTYWLANTQYVTALALSGTPLPGFPKTIMTATDLNSHSSVHVADVEGDGDFDLTVSGASQNSGRVWLLPVDGSTAGPQARADWPKMRRTSDNRGFYQPSIDPTGVAEAFRGEGLRIGPNPLAGPTLYLSVDGNAAGTIRVWDASGRSVGSVELRGAARFDRERVLGAAGPGVYFLQWVGAGRESTRRLVVLR